MFIATACQARIYSNTAKRKKNASVTHRAHLAVRARPGLRQRRSRVRRAVDVNPRPATGRGRRTGRPTPSGAQSVDQGVDEPLLRVAAGRLVHEREAFTGDLLNELGPYRGMHRYCDTGWGGGVE